MNIKIIYMREYVIRVWIHGIKPRDERLYAINEKEAMDIVMKSLNENELNELTWLETIEA